MLGICVGMQILFEASEEFGETPGLGILPGRVRIIPNITTSGVPQRVPHIGWNHLIEPQAGRVLGRNPAGTVRRRRPCGVFRAFICRAASERRAIGLPIATMAATASARW